MPQRPSLFLISFSVIESDPRVLKQVARLSLDYDVTTCGYGPAVPATRAHIQIPAELGHTELYGRFITLHWYRAAYWRLPAMRWVRDHVPAGAFDIVFANEIESMPVALRLKPRNGIHLDLHEYTPLINEEYPAWLRRISPYYEWLCRRYGTKAKSWTTVSQGLKREYKRNFGYDADLVTNAAPYAELRPAAPSDVVRLVHSGACLRNRDLMLMIDAVAESKAPVTFDLYLTPNDPGYLEELKRRAADVPGVEVHDPVPYRELVPTLNRYDIGVHLLAPTNFNNTWALPNKLFDYVQARLGVLIGPTAEMADYVERYGLGRVADAFTSTALAEQIRTISLDDVARYKAASNANARELSSEHQVEIWADTVSRLAGRVPA